ncbi:GntR family transcriptional regulator [Paenibacillus sp.]|jgi:DNA-binding GntR family transcriptional regulator|uniref:GntR family transcriptional regulator n=1 Tax=Paenibacillus sp. TaxID=58172 RepID=UPI00281C6FB8|nr:GntR family transcriptional regulator [Paenibacillus sp.]MDR0266920.1 GntR family transcriptional regulator [Paenibacillus sp.]
MDETMLQQSGSAGNAVYQKLKQQIVSLDLPPGTTLSEKETSLTFQVSRTPVRESFVRLAQEGLVLVLPQRGTRVSLIDSDMVEEARFMREQLEKAVIRLACEAFPDDKLSALESNLAEQQQAIEQHDGKRMFELDEAFHRILFAGCRKSGTWNVIQQMNAHLNRTRVLWLWTDPHWELLYEQHREMFLAVKQQDADRAEQIMKEHMLLSIANLPVLKARYPEYFK